VSAKPRRFEVASTQASVLDELTAGVPATAAMSPAPPAPAAERHERAPQVEPPPKKTRVPIRVQVPEDIADRFRAGVAALAYRVPAWQSLNEAVADAMEQYVAAAEAEHNGGERFPWEPGRQLQSGRRVGH